MMPVAEAPVRTSPVARTLFWIVAVLGVFAAIVVWVWYGFAQFEAQTEQVKALSAGTSMAGFAELLGSVPLVLAHLVGLTILIVLGWRGLRRPGLAYAIIAVIVASAIGILCAQLVWQGELFELGINNDTFIP